MAYWDVVARLSINNPPGVILRTRYMDYELDIT